MKVNNENQNKENEENINNKKAKKFTLSIDYSKFQQKFKNNKENANKESNIIINEEKTALKIEEKNRIENNKNQKNLEQFLNISGILDESKASFLDNQSNNIYSENNYEDEQNKKLKEIISNKINKNEFNNLNDLSENNKEQELILSIDYNNLIKSKINNNKNSKNFNNDENKSIERTYGQNSKKSFISASNRQNKYSKFLNNRNNGEIIKNINSKNYSNDKNALNTRENKKKKINSYAQMIKNNNNINNNIKKPIENKPKVNNSFLLFNGVNYNHNKSNFSEISYNALSTATGEITDNSKTRNKIKNKNNINYSNLTHSYNLRPFYNQNKSYDIKDKKEISNNNLICYSDNKHKSIGNNNTKSISFNSKILNSKINSNKKDDGVINLIDNMKNKLQKQENKYINQQKDMKNEIKILKEKLKELSVNETLYQVEIEKLKRSNNKNENKQKKLNKTNNKEEKTANQKYFGQKLDNIIKKYNKQNETNINKNDQLLNMFDLNKDFLEGEDIYDENDNNNYEEVLNNYPRLKKFIQVLSKKYKNEKEYRMRLEEKTIEIFTNDLKKINYLEKKIKNYEVHRHYKGNPSLNYSFDNDFVEANITKNSYKSCDKNL